MTTTTTTTTVAPAHAPIWLANPAAQDVALAGGKAAPLARLVAAGVRVPPGFVVPAAAYQDAIAPLRAPLEALLPPAGGPPEQLEAAAARIRELVDSRPLPAALEEAIRRETAELFTRTADFASGLLAVRSSATAEDLAGASFAGQYDTYLGLRDADQVLAHVRRCWASYWSARAISYRQQRAIAHWDGAMAVLVQRLVPADAAGVAFTADPAGGFRYLVMVNAALGLGEGVVEGSVPVDNYAVDKDLRQVVQRQVKPKTQRIVPAPESGTATVDVPEDLASAPALTDAQLLELADTAVTLEGLAGCPQDVEWAWCAGQLYVLQSRPITALPPDPLETFPVAWDDLQDRALHWKRGPAPAKPLEQDIGALSRQAWVDTAPLTGREKAPTGKVHNQYVYWTDRPAWASDVARQAAAQVFQARCDQLWEQGQAIGPAEHLPELVAHNQRLLAFDRQGASGAALAGHLEDAARRFVRSWTLHWVFVMDHYREGTDAQQRPRERWKLAYQELTGDQSERGHEALLDGVPNKLLSAIDRLMQLAELAQQHPALRHAMEQREPRDFLAALEGELAGTPGVDAARGLLRTILEEQGLRSGAGFGARTNPLTPGWIEEPSLVVEIARKYLPQDIGRLRRIREGIDQRREAALAAALARVGDDPQRRARFERAYGAARASVEWFENHNYHIDSAAQTLLRMALIAAARRLTARGVLDAPEDVMWLHLAEIGDTLRACQRGERPELGATIAARQAEHERCAQLAAPQWIGAPAPPRTEADSPGQQHGPGDATDEDPARAAAVLVRGKSGSRGIATGRVRLIPVETPVPDVQPGDVLVAKNAGPLWTPVFPTLAAIVLDEGVYSQHAMLTAREYEVAAVFECREATKTLHEGQTVTVDGTRGLVLRVDEPA